jgi:hypothetical protein
MSDLHVEPTALRSAAARLGGVGDRVRELHRTSPSPDPGLWGPIGRAVGASTRYQELVSLIDEHLVAAVRFCDQAGVALRRTAEVYEAADQRSAHAFASEGCHGP